MYTGVRGEAYLIEDERRDALPAFIRLLEDFSRGQVLESLTELTL